jgi:cytochrome c
MKAHWINIPAAVLAVLTIVSSGRALADEALAKKSGCLKCHSVDKKVIGPAFQDIALKYKHDSNARSELIKKVKNGGKGHWTDVTHGVPMPPFSGCIPDADIKALVDWILSLKTETH